MTSQKKFLLRCQSLHERTEVSIDWSNFFLLSGQIPLGVVVEVSIDSSKIFFFHQSKPMINILFECVVTGLSIDNSKIFFFRHLFFIVRVSWWLGVSIEWRNFFGALSEKQRFLTCLCTRILYQTCTNPVFSLFSIPSFELLNERRALLRNS